MEDFTTAPLTRQDAAAVAHVWRTSEIHDDGEALFTEEDFVVACERPSMDLERHTIGVRDGGELVALGLLFGERSVFAYVLPSHRGRGIGAWLLRWSEDASRAAGRARATQSLSENEHAARALLESHSYARSWEDWIFEIGLDSAPVPPRLPEGYALREFARGRDDRAVYDVIETAFAEWPDHDGESYADWSADTFSRPGFEPR